MATINNPVVKNLSSVSGTNVFNQVWMCTRAMKKAGWKYAGSGNGTTKNTSIDPAADLWNGAAGIGGITNVGSNAAVIAAPTRGRATITGLTGIVSADKGRFIVISGSATGANNNAHQIEEIISATEVRIDARTFAVAADAVGRNWEIRDPMVETYPTALNTVAAWSLWIGPATVKIPVTAVPTGRFLRGENVVQASTGAEGEFLGRVWDGSTGYLVILPRVRGVSAPTTAYGWETGNVITGSGSGATVAQNGTALTYVNEIVFYKSTDQASGSIYIGCVDPVNDSADDFLTLKGAAGCTATVAPGGGGTSNAFPAKAWQAIAGATVTTHGSWARSTTTAANAHIMCADAIEEVSRSADGSWLYAISDTAVTGVGHHINGFQFMDDSEPGDLNPWAQFRSATGLTLYGHVRTAPANGGASSIDNDRIPHGQAYPYGAGWLARGTSREKFIDLDASTLHLELSNLRFGLRNAGNPHKHQSQTLLPLGLERFWFICADAASPATNYKMIKGVPRWMRLVAGGSSYSVYQDVDSSERVLLQLGVTTAGTNRVYCVGPWDGSVDAVAS